MYLFISFGSIMVSTFEYENCYGLFMKKVCNFYLVGCRSRRKLSYLVEFVEFSWSSRDRVRARVLLIFYIVCVGSALFDVIVFRWVL